MVKRNVLVMPLSSVQRINPHSVLRGRAPRSVARKIMGKVKRQAGWKKPPRKELRAYIVKALANEMIIPRNWKRFTLRQQRAILAVASSPARALNMGVDFKTALERFSLREMGNLGWSPRSFIRTGATPNQVLRLNTIPMAELVRSLHPRLMRVTARARRGVRRRAIANP